MLFFQAMRVPALKRAVLKAEAKLAKAFCVLIKRKLQSEQLPRARLFRQLMALVMNPQQEDIKFIMYRFAASSWINI